MSVLKLSEAKAHLGSYARKAHRGETFVLADRNCPIASLGPYRESSAEGIQPKFGLADGLVSVPDDFNAAVESFEKDFYGS